MSVPVDLSALRAELAGEGGSAYLVTVGESGAPHVVSVVVTWDGDRLAVGGGRRTAANAAARPAVTLLWPTPTVGGLSLLVDGAAEVDGERVLVAPTSAIRHRSVTDPDGARRSDCAELPAPR
ncbi:MAG: pyridoxamine 5'-phosphate oxidase family protein [Acidimicrobiia bacterium]